ncbi:MAG: adenylate/guanylate cyclase domain-containing protein, partial [Pseudomonadota bacterium]
MSEAGAENRSVEDDLREAERDGLLLTLRWRRYALSVLLVFIAFGAVQSGNPIGLAIAATALALGIAHEALIRSAWERWWQRYVFAVIDVCIITSVLAFVPVTSAGEVPQILAFRNLGPLYLVPLILSALSLSPKLVLWTGGITVLGLWAAFGWIVSGMERAVSWGDLPRDATAEAYLDLVLDPDFIALGNRTGETLMIVLASCVIALATHRARRVVRARSEAQAERMRVARLFGRYVPTEVARKVLANEDALKPQTRHGTVLYLDIAEFTTLSEQVEPVTLIDILNAAFERIGQIVSARDGVVVGYAGDAVLAAFNAPLPNADHAGSAVVAAAEIADTVMRERFSDRVLKVRIGIATGYLSAGSIGASDRQAYTIYGDTVNCAQRLEAANKSHGSVIMIDA